MKLVNAHIADLESCDDLNMRQFLMKYINSVYLNTIY